MPGSFPFSWRHPAVRLALVLCLLGAFAAGVRADDAAATQPAASPHDLIEKLSNRVLALLADKQMAKKDKRRRIQELAYANIDFQTLGQLTLGQYWRPLSADQRKDFIKEFRTHLANTYRSMIDNYKDETVKMAGARDESRGDFTVFTKVVNPHSAETFDVNYRVRKQNGEWRIIDISIEGVDLAVNFREQFKEIVGNGGFEHLMQVLRDKNAAAEKEDNAE
jgi:phospholipid transport system substrate-binding protein